MRIVIDLQGAQTESRFRGIGRYSLSFAKAIVRNRGNHEVFIALSDLFPETIEPLRKVFYEILPQENIRVWNAPGPVREENANNTWRREVAELIREAFISNLKPDVIHITSFFEGYVDDAVTSIGRFNKKIPVSISLYDLIPLLNPDEYLKPLPSYESFYLRKIDQLNRASLLLAISDFSQQEGIKYLTQENSSIINISASVEDVFKPLTLDNSKSDSIKKKFGLHRDFVLYTGGADTRKNLARLIKAYARLSISLRKSHLLVFAGKIPNNTIQELNHIAKSKGLDASELIFTGYVTDEELVALYNLCKLYVFPSWHEGFGLPALEAMSCGAAVIGSNSTSLPEVIGREDALFDPGNINSIAEKLKQVLADDSMKLSLQQHGIKQAKKFSWDKSAILAIDAFERLYINNRLPSASASAPAPKPKLKLAYISPLPPERSGISNYSAELLPELSRHYDIDVIIAQNSTSDSWINSHCKTRSVKWFKANADYYDRVLYHFGNSPFHQHMFGLLNEIPGTVVLHDFYLSAVIANMETTGLSPDFWVQELYKAHGYQAVQERYHTQNLIDVIYRYPCNLSVLRDAHGIIVHSNSSRNMAKSWLPHEISNWATIPLLRTPALEADRTTARHHLKLNNNDFLICSFGLIDPTKLNHLLLDAWLSSEIAKSKNCLLIFVGENHGGEYGQQILDTIQGSDICNQVCITGWVDDETYKYYLAAADIGVQLRTLSRGETSAAVLDCMNFGLPTIVNANGSMVDLPDNAVWKLTNDFPLEHLREALENLWVDTSRRKQLGKRAQEVILNQHSPQKCSAQYTDAIEQFYVNAQIGQEGLIKAIATLNSPYIPSSIERTILARSIAHNQSEIQSHKSLFIDISATSRNDLKTGIERVTRALLLALLNAPPEGYRVEPVYLSDSGGRWRYHYARAYTLDLLGCKSNVLADEEIEAQPGDIILGLDLFGQGVINSQAYLDSLHRIGVKINFLIHDLLPILMPHMFPPGADEAHQNWLRTITRYDGAICVTKAVADSLSDWVNENRASKPVNISWSHSGADFENSRPSRGFSQNSAKVLETIKGKTSFLVVGTIEPRKGHIQILSAFEQLWKNGFDLNLVIVGSEGWKGLPDNMRRTIPSTLDRLRSHPELGERLFWLEGISDEYLEKIYAASSCLIAASEGEGFGLPLIESAQYKLPIIARDIPVFHEVAGDYAHYFSGTSSQALVSAIKQWLSLQSKGLAPQSENISWLTWEQSSKLLIEKIIN